MALDRHSGGAGRVVVRVNIDVTPTTVVHSRSSIYFPRHHEEKRYAQVAEARTSLDELVLESPFRKLGP